MSLFISNEELAVSKCKSCEIYQDTFILFHLKFTVGKDFIIQFSVIASISVSVTSFQDRSPRKHSDKQNNSENTYSPISSFLSLSVLRVC